MSEIYSIIKQHDDNKNVDVWVIRIGKEFNENILVGLKRLVLFSHGYFSFYDNYNAFIFKDENNAIRFSNKIDSCFRNGEENIANIDLDSYDMY